eukprot:gb/GFBE01045212.1/.p1 GENE.gb/GFBE01045212.1/~~gb/GFBE01045212.1/.p1  ORF type:complete len:196 (+),score=27.63 gb/GFBE01045212.1/:1-588(+)
MDTAAVLLHVAVLHLLCLPLAPAGEVGLAMPAVQACQQMIAQERQPHLDQHEKMKLAQAEERDILDTRVRQREVDVKLLRLENKELRKQIVELRKSLLSAISKYTDSPKCPESQPSFPRMPRRGFWDLMGTFVLIVIVMIVIPIAVCALRPRHARDVVLRVVTDVYFGVIHHPTLQGLAIIVVMIVVLTLSQIIF